MSKTAARRTSASARPEQEREAVAIGISLRNR